MVYATRLFRSSIQGSRYFPAKIEGRKRFPLSSVVFCCALTTTIPFLVYVVCTPFSRDYVGNETQKSKVSFLNVTVLVMSEGHRVQELTQILRYYLFESPANVYVPKVHLVWNSNASYIPLSSKILDHKKFIIHRESTNTLNNRYRHWRSIETEAALLLDDDCLVTDLRSALMIHRQKRFRERLITFFARTHRFGTNGLSYSNPKRMNGSYSLGTGQATLLSTRWIQAFSTDKRLTRIRDFIDNNRPTCEDIALHMYASNVSGQPPLLVSAGQTELRFSSKSGMSKAKDWSAKRKHCLNSFVERDFQGKIPLVYSEYKTPVTLQEVRVDIESDD